MPRISVLIPVRDAESTIGRAIRTTLRALPRDAEVVVWNDGSTDGTAHALSRIDDRRLRVLGSDVSLGIGATLRELVAATDSEFVARMDADDVCLPWRFAVQVGLMRRTPMDLLFSSIIAFRTGPFRARPTMPRTIRPEAMALHLAVTNLLCHPSLIARRSAIELAGGYRDVPAEDYDLWLRASAAGLRLTRHAIPVLAYRHHGGQVSGAAGYLDRVRVDPAVRDAYRRMVREQFGLDTGPGGTRSEEAAWRADLLRPVLLERSAGLDPGQRRLVMRTLRLLPQAAPAGP